MEKAARERMIDVVTEVDGRPLSRWGCDGVVFATPTGSTAYAFSAGGPVVWPEVEALLMVPISAHALFAGPDGRLAAVGARRGGPGLVGGSEPGSRGLFCGAMGGGGSTSRPARGWRCGAAPSRCCWPGCAGGVTRP